ncbi:isoprenylcysteine carboxylmethyltransferase family protein [bacterium]|nr:isoprenylcysteine carboxylmethyltransferase family protein [bacterium]MCG2676713.1 isoprenylcysteine carboxylmethyltransferase family protein [bacterium]
MKKFQFRTLLQILIAFPIVFVILPYFAIKINNNYSLPVYDYIYFKIIGLALATIGLVIVIHCAYVLFFKPKQDLPFPGGLLRPPEKFIVEGLYKFVRNPMVLGYFIIILSEFFMFGHLLVLIYLIIMTLFANIIIFKEEKQLEKSFGREYVRYKERVPRWIPRFRTRNQKNEKNLPPKKNKIENSNHWNHIFITDIIANGVSRWFISY